MSICLQKNCRLVCLFIVLSIPLSGAAGVVEKISRALECSGFVIGATPIQGTKASDFKSVSALSLVGPLLRNRMDAEKFFSAIIDRHGPLIRIATAAPSLSKDMYVIADRKIMFDVLKDNTGSFDKDPRHIRVGEVYKGASLSLIALPNEKWKWFHDQFKGIFDSRTLAQGNFSQKVSDLTDVQIERIDKDIRNSPDGKITISPTEFSHRLIIEIFLRFFVGVEPTPADVDTLIQLRNRVSGLLKLELTNPLSFPLISLPSVTPIQSRWKKALAEFQEFNLNLVRQAKRLRPESRTPFMRALTTLKHEDGSELSETDMAGQLAFFIRGAHETTGASLASLLLNANNDPDTMALVMKEAASFEDRGGDAPDREYPATAAILTETMRWQTPAFALARVATQDITLTFEDGKTVKIPSGSRLLFPMSVINRLEDQWGVGRMGPPAGQFNAGRFLPENLKAKGINARAANVCPFGAGERVCIGNTAAWTELKIIVLKLFNHYQIRPLENDSGKSLSEIVNQPAPDRLIEVRPRTN